MSRQIAKSSRKVKLIVITAQVVRQVFSPPITLAIRSGRRAATLGEVGQAFFSKAHPHIAQITYLQPGNEFNVFLILSISRSTKRSLLATRPSKTLSMLCAFSVLLLLGHSS